MRPTHLGISGFIHVELQAMVKVDCAIETLERFNFDLSSCIIHKGYELDGLQRNCFVEWCIVSSRQELDIQVHCFLYHVVAIRDKYVATLHFWAS